MKRLLYFQAAVVSLLLVSIMLTGDAYAQCVAAGNPAGGLTAVCTGVDNAGFDGTNNPDMVTIQPGAEVVPPAGPAVDFLDGDDTFIMNGGLATNDPGTGNIIDGDAGNDTFTINGGVITGTFAINGASGDDNVTINDGEINGEVNLSNDNDTLTMFGGSITTDRDGINCGGGNDNIDIRGGTVTGGTDGTGRGINCSSGEDKISVSFATITGGDPDLDFSAIDAGNDNDEITLGTAAVINGLIDCGEGFDTLIFAMDVPAAAVESISSAILRKDPAGDSIVINRLFYEWEECDELIPQLVGGSFPVPTLSEWGLIAMAVILGVIGVIVARRRFQTV